MVIESTSVASTKTDSVRSRLAPISEKPLPTSQAAATTTNRASASSPTSRSASWPTTSLERSPQPARRQWLR